MRHGKKFNHLGRKSQHRKATLMNLANSLITHKRIKTTVAKAKALRIFVEPLITKSKDDSTHSRRIVFSYLKDKEAVTTLFRDVSAKVAERAGGYTRIIKIGTRYGDNAEMCYIELVDYNENLLTSKKADKKKTRRSRSKKTTTTNQPTAETTTEVKDEIVDATVVEEKKEAPKTDKVEKTEKKESPKAKPEIKKEEPKAEKKVVKKEEKPVAEKKETPKKDAEPKAEVKKEEPKAEKKDNSKKTDKDSEGKAE